jgi:membrane associated rhomboid family serine protease
MHAGTLDAVAEVQHCYRHPDRETGLSCSECGRPICVDCMTVAPVGIRCPEHAGRTARPTPKPVRAAQRTAARRGIVIGDGLVTRALVALNVLVYLITVAQGSGINDPGGSLFAKWALFGPAVSHGDWWRLITAAFLHAGLLHIAFNMWALLWLGVAVESALGWWRFLLLYFASGLAGSAGALVASPNAVTVGASGAIFGLLGAGLVLEYRATGRLGGSFLTVIVINLAISAAVPGISIGGHVGGLIGGIVGASIIVLRNRIRETVDLPTVAGLAAVGALSIAIAYWKVRGLA